ncbi:hypothetical protein PC120_g11019 [Phytophthora cactorum]|nr:hypothetical protein PC120_g11019 [Phytophthora cactorum]
MEYEHGAENQPMDGNPSMRSPSESATHIACADCPHLSDPEWEALQRLATVIGEAQGVARCYCRYDYDGVIRDDTARAVIETAREQLSRRIFDDPSKAAFAMSCLGGRARSWAYGRRLTDATCFGTYAEFKE